MLHKVGRAKGHGLILYRLNVYESESGGGGGGWAGPTKLYTPLRVVKKAMASADQSIIVNVNI